MLATEPLKPDMLDRISQTRTPFGDPALSFCIGRIYENRLIFNGIDRASRVTPEDDRHLPSFIKLHKEMLRRFPFLESVSLAGAWGGAVQPTPSDAPIVQRSKSNPNVILNIGYGGGSGVGMALLSGQLTTGLVLERGPIDNDAQRLRTLFANSRFPRMGPVRAAFGVLRKIVFG
jgi:glycine/D-amino acid oxidase-like deaminating enzyme